MSLDLLVVIALALAGAFLIGALWKSHRPACGILGCVCVIGAINVSGIYLPIGLVIAAVLFFAGAALKV